MKTLLFRIASAALYLVLRLATVHAQVPQLINYQGRIVVGSTNFTGTGNFKFALVNATGTTAYWTNDGTHLDGTEPTNAVSVTVSDGLYSVLLGDTTLSNMTAVPATVFNNADVRLRIWFDDGTHGSEQLGPDQRIAAVGYAVMAGNVPDGAITSAKMANGAVGVGQLANGAITSAKIANGAVGSSQLANGAVTSAQINTASVQKRITGSAPAGQFIKSINADGTVVASSLTPAGSSTQLQFNNSGAFGGLSGVKWDSTHTSLSINGDIPADIASTPEAPNGGRLTILGTGDNTDALAIVGDHRVGTTGPRYATIIRPNGGIITNAYIDIAASGTVGDGGVLRLNSDIPVAMSIYTPYNPSSGGRLFHGFGIPATGDATPIVMDITSMGRVTLNDPYGAASGYINPQLVLADSSTTTSDSTHRAYGFRVQDGLLRIGLWDDAAGNFFAPYVGDIQLSPADCTIVGNLVNKTSQFEGKIFFGDKINGVAFGVQSAFIFYHGNTTRIIPDADGALSLGSSGARFRNLWLSGTGTMTGLTVQGGDGNFTVTDGSIVDTTRSTLYVGYNGGAGTNVNLAGGKATVSASTGKLTTTGGVQPPHLADGSAASDTIYYSTTMSALVYKDAGGTVHRLY